MAVRHELWCVLESTGDSQSNCNNRNHNLGFLDTELEEIWTFIICIVKERVMQKLIVIGLLVYLPFLLPFPILLSQL